MFVCFSLLHKLEFSEADNSTRPGVLDTSLSTGKVLSKAICYSPLVVKSDRHICNVLSAETDQSLALTSERCFVSMFFFF